MEYKTETIKGIKLVYRIRDNSVYMNKTECDKQDNETYLEVVKWIDINSEKLLSKGFKKVEWDSIMGFYSRNIRKGRFIHITTMDSLRLLKR